MEEIIGEERVMQGTRPICGLCAFLNGFCQSDDDSNEWKNTVDNLWNYCITDLPDDISCLNAKQLRYSVIGEFFSSRNLVDFINVKKHCIVKLLHDINPKIQCYEAMEINKFDEVVENQKDFYLIPIDSGEKWFGKNKNNIHWICLKFEDKKPIILNSVKHRENEGKAIWHSQKACRKINLSYLFQSINTIKELEKVWEAMRNREKYM